jgi:putative aldouronate transport system permease protein
MVYYRKGGQAVKEVVIKRKRNSYSQNRTTIGDIINIVIITILSLSCIIPFIHIAAKSVSSNSAVLAKNVYLLPKGLNFDAYTSIFKDGQMTHSMLYTIMLTVIFTALGMLVTVCAAYPLSKKRLKGRGVITFIFMFSWLFSAGLIPEYLILRDYGLLDTMWALILPVMFSPFNMIIMKNYMQTAIPDSLEESAFLDGATDFQVLFKIVLPLSKPIIATLSLFFAVGRWNAYADARYYITERALQPLQYLLSNMVLSSSADSVSIIEGTQAASTPEVLQAAMVMFATLPIICVYPFVQKYFVTGVMIGAVKG